MQVTINIVCEELPQMARATAGQGGRGPGRCVYLGLQRGEAVVDVVPVAESPMALEAVFRVAEREDGTTNFLGPYAQRSAAERFFYLCWLDADEGGEPTRNGRAKVHLSHLPWPVVARAAESGEPLTVRLSLTGRRASRGADRSAMARRAGRSNLRDRLRVQRRPTSGCTGAGARECS